MQKRKEKKRKEKKRKKKKFIDYFSTLFEGTIGEEPSSYMGSIPEYSVKFTVWILRKYILFFWNTDLILTDPLICYSKIHNAVKLP